MERLRFDLPDYKILWINMKGFDEKWGISSLPFLRSYGIIIFSPIPDFGEFLRFARRSDRSRLSREFVRLGLLPGRLDSIGGIGDIDGGRSYFLHVHGVRLILPFVPPYLDVASSNR